MTDAWEMHQAETGLNPGPVWRDRGIIINTLTERSQALEERVAELEGSCQKLRDDYQGALAERNALRARIEALADDMDERGKPDANDSALDAQSRRQIREDVKRLRAALASHAEDTTPTEQQAQGGGYYFDPGPQTHWVNGGRHNKPLSKCVECSPVPVADPSGDTP